jgi:beta-glucosidase
MTLEEKVNATRGFTGTCVGNTGAVPRLGIEPMCLADAPDGIRGQEFVSAFPAGIHVAATFDRDLMYAYGRALGEEYPRYPRCWCYRYCKGLRIESRRGA